MLNFEICVHHVLILCCFVMTKCSITLKVDIQDELISKGKILLVYTEVQPIMMLEKKEKKGRLLLSIE